MERVGQGGASGVVRVAAINNHPSHVLDHWVTGRAGAKDKMAAPSRGYVSNVT